MLGLPNLRPKQKRNYENAKCNDEATSFQKIYHTKTQTDMPRFQMNKFPNRTVDIGINPLHIRITLDTVKAFFGKLSAVRLLLGFREISCRQPIEFVQKKQSRQKLAEVGIAYNILTIFISLYF